MDSSRGSNDLRVTTIIMAQFRTKYGQIRMLGSSVLWRLSPGPEKKLNLIPQHAQLLLDR